MPSDVSPTPPGVESSSPRASAAPPGTGGFALGPGTPAPAASRPATPLLAAGGQAAGGQAEGGQAADGQAAGGQAAGGQAADNGAADRRAAYHPSAAFVALLGAMTALGAMTVDTYLPSLPTVAADLGTTDTAAQFTISGVLLGAALGQLLVGPLSDRFGRRRPALVGLGLHVVASLLCMMVPSIGGLIVLRMVQGVGNSAAAITATAVIRDRLTGGPAARVLSRLFLVIGLAPLLAPTVGGFVAGVAGWRAVFGVLAALGLGLAVVVWRFLPETLPPERRTAAGLGGALRGYRRLVADRRFVALAVLPGLSLGALISYVVGSPFVIQVGYGLTAHQFALVFALNGVGFVLGSQVNARLVRQVAPIRIVRVALPLGLGIAAVLLVVAATGAGGLVGLLVPLWFLLAVIGLIPPNASAMALSRHGERAGAAAALIGFAQSGIAGLVSPLVGFLGGDAVAMAVMILASIGAALVVLAVATPAYRAGFPSTT